MRRAGWRIGGDLSVYGSAESYLVSCFVMQLCEAIVSKTCTFISAAGVEVRRRFVMI